MLDIIMRAINVLLTVTTVLILIWFIFSSVIKFKKNIAILKFRITSIIAFLIGMSINLFVIYCLIWLINFFAIRV
ncbi:hypothetical protein [Leptotrichia massiliensis]|uniref:hypothetical protein n=1 Tax=Leptotrichia massiliensis TaxID=1852388 RepID=UPI0008DA5A00|nr:hypothetical protein [Leptotrichia massiliensis]